MILAIDVKYNNEEAIAKAVGVLFNRMDKMPERTIIKYVQNIHAYIPGLFYKRELPCILEILKDVNLTDIEAIIVDGHVYIDNENNYGLGAHLWQNLNGAIAVIGVAKTEFRSNKETVIKVFRGESIKPLYVSAIGMSNIEAANIIKQMHGEYRMPTVLKEVDRLTKEENVMPLS